MFSTEKSSRKALLLAMCIFGTIGIFRRYIPLSSSLVALVRGSIGSVFLIFVLKLRGQKWDLAAIRRNLLLLVLSGAAIGFNWILLFEAYNYTTVATATLCYYLAPILVILAAPVVCGERLTPRKLLCAAAALAGMVLVSGVLEEGAQGTSGIKGIGFGIGAAVLYACVILMNKKLKSISAIDKTVVQLVMASAALIPYVLLTGELSGIRLEPLSAILLLTVGILHTGLAYWIYFGSMNQLPAQSVALLSYLDPILAIILSMVLLNEPMSFLSAVGALMILGAAYISER